ncbi:MAG: response regulator transcription factor [Firmicutes bacterium]|nr:response regulator transcription factor [Bacillota bacterium]
MREKILIVDDEDSIVKLVDYNLGKEGFQTIVSYSGDDAWERIVHERPDLVVLDVMLPGLDGISLLKKMRQEKLNLPVIMLTARGEEIDRVMGLELGCDDYVTKPFSPRELAARIKAVLRRTQEAGQPASHRITIGRLVIDIDQYEAMIDGEELPLTPKEFELLAFMAQNRGRVMTRELLLEKVWGYDYQGDTRIVDVNISHLRDKVEKDPKNPELIKTVRGVGYRIPAEKG